LAAKRNAQKHSKDRKAAGIVANTQNAGENENGNENGNWAKGNGSGKWKWKVGMGERP